MPQSFYGATIADRALLIGTVLAQLTVSIRFPFASRYQISGCEVGPAASGEGGIRTPVGLAPQPVFKTGAAISQPETGTEDRETSQGSGPLSGPELLIDDPDLFRLIDIWPTLSADVKARILTLAGLTDSLVNLARPDPNDTIDDAG